jgi:dihydrofolate reductase
MNKAKNTVFIARSLDGYIADTDGGIDWLNAVPNPEGIDMGFNKLMNRIDAIVMGRNTFETVLSFDGPWPYSKPVYVLSSTLSSVPEALDKKVVILAGEISDVLRHIHQNGHLKLYIDGGGTIQNFLSAHEIDEITITTIPVLLGGGLPLFRKTHESMSLEHVSTEVFLNQMVQSTYRVNRR